MFLNIDGKHFEALDVLNGPKASECKKIIAKSLVREYCPQAKIQQSKLKINTVK